MTSLKRPASASQSSSSSSSSSSNQKKPEGQKTLFSFFAKKPDAPAFAPVTKKATNSTKTEAIVATVAGIPCTSTSTSTSPAAPPSNAVSAGSGEKAETATLTQSPPSKDKWQRVNIGTRLSVYWPDDGTYYKATVTAKRGVGKSNFTLKYDDGEIETIDLSNERFRFLDDNDNEEQSQSQSQSQTEQTPVPKRRRIAEESDEEEFEFDDEMSAESEGSTYEDDPDAVEDDEDEHSMITDDEDEKETTAKQSKKKQNTNVKVNTKAKPRFQVTQMKEPSKTPPSKRATIPSINSYNKKSNTGNSTFFSTPKNNSNRMTTPNNAFSRFDSNSADASASTKKAAQQADFARKVSPSPPVAAMSKIQTPSPMTIGHHQRSTTTSTPLKATPGIVNPAGSHFHNHLKFIQHPKDAQGRTPDDPNFDRKTLKVDYNELMRKGNGGKITPAMKQWWDLKADYMDSILFFKTGKFYELYQMDADVGVSVLNFTYMRGDVAHAGFPEISYGVMAERLVQAGYKVARVEQTETPDMLKERKKRERGKGPAPQVVNREVCSILTSGTRTFCYMDDTKGLLNEMKQNTSSSYGPLLVIRETLLEQESTFDTSKSEEEEDGVRPVCEYGITLVDAVRATVTIGQFADDVLRSRMNTLLTTFCPLEIIIQGGEDGASATLLSLLRSSQAASGTKIETIHAKENSPKSSAIDNDVRRRMERLSPTVQPWNVEDTLKELHRRGYYPKSSRSQSANSKDTNRHSRWPKVLQAAVDGGAELALSSFGATLFYLQRNLIDQDILGMGIVKAYVPPAGAANHKESQGGEMGNVVREQQREEDGMDTNVDDAIMEDATNRKDHRQNQQQGAAEVNFMSMDTISNEESTDHLALDGTTLQNLEILTNSNTHTASGSLWSKINHTKSPHGARLLRAWLLRPLFRKTDIERRADAVQELVSGSSAMGMSEARGVLSKCGDIERLLSRIHSMGGATNEGVDNSHHPNERAVLYEGKTHTKRKVADFSKVLNGLRYASQIPELFAGVTFESGLLSKIVQSTQCGGCFPVMTEALDWFFDNFDLEKAAEGQFVPTRGIDDEFDEASDAIERIMRELDDYKDSLCNNFLRPKHIAKAHWKYINTKEDSKDKYLIELPVTVEVPDDFLVIGKRGKGQKQVNKYRTPEVEQLVIGLEQAIAVQKVGKANGMQMVFAKFDSMRHLWAAAAQATAMLDALGSLAQTATKPGFTRPTILDCPPDSMPKINVFQGRHACVDITHSGGEFIPNNLSLGEKEDASRVLLLSGPNMGGKSTLLRQTCLIAILAQIGCYVPAAECSLTPIDRIYTRLGASDRILLGQSTFFVELAETAAALRGATRRSLVIMDELGRGTSTFDGTAIASATMKHLVERNQCLTLFATHYHSLLNDWKDEPYVRLGHMECVVEGSDEAENSVLDESDESDVQNITFLYSLGDGACPNSFGINVARLANLPAEVLSKAKNVSSNFENEMTDTARVRVTASNSTSYSQKIRTAIESGDFDQAEKIWEELHTS